MDESHLLAAARYIEMNPVTAKMVSRPEDYRWSSARAHMEGRDDGLVETAPLLQIVGNWREYLTQQLMEKEVKAIEFQTAEFVAVWIFLSNALLPGLRKLRARFLHRFMKLGAFRDRRGW